jgi:uncharacterized protein DUF5947
MTAGAGTRNGLRLGSLARRARAERVEAQERCDLCGEPLPAEHRHLLDLESREVMCTCRPCRILFDRQAAGGGHFRLIPERRLRLSGFEMSDAAWEELRIPVDMAYFFHSSAAERVVAYYPGPMGATESLLELGAWQSLEAANQVLADMEPDVEALLVNRARGAQEHWIVPIDDCYQLVGLIRLRWRGLTGGKDVWEEIGRFFAALERKETAKWRT